MKKLLASRTFWTIAIMVAMNVTQVIEPYANAEVIVLMNAILGALASYFKVNPSQEY